MKNILAILLLCATVILTSCQKDESTTPVSGVTINKTAIALVIGTKETLTATVLPDNATDKDVTWSSSNTSIATVSTTGEVSAISAGTATITVASVNDKSKTATCKVTVTNSTVAISGVTLNKNTLSLPIGGKETLIATVSPDEATNKTVTWTSSDTSVAKVSTNGEVGAISAGTATIIVAAVNDKNKADTCKVTVTNSTVAVSGVTLNKNTLSLPIGEKETLIATVSPDEATNKTVTWTSSDASVATVSTTGEVSAVGAGTTTITVASVGDKTKTATCEVTVIKPGIAVSGVSLNKETLPLLIGTKETLLATVSPDEATDKNVTWTSSDVSVATVSTTGEVSAVGAGTATITVASVNDKTKTDACTVTVTVPTSTTAAIGNFYYADRSMTNVYDKTKTCIGIVFWVDPLNNQKGKIVSLDEQELEWSVKTESTGATNNTNGRSNMYQINEFVRASVNSVWEDYPAFYWVATAKNGRLVGGWDDTDMWCLPAQGDLVTLFGSDGATMTAVNASLNSIPGAVTLTPNIYCSSTEKDDANAIFVSFSTGLSQNIVKFSANKVRAIAAF